MEYPRLVYEPTVASQSARRLVVGAPLDSRLESQPASGGSKENSPSEMFASRSFSVRILVVEVGRTSGNHPRSKSLSALASSSVPYRLVTVYGSHPSKESSTPIATMRFMRPNAVLSRAGSNASLDDEPVPASA